MHERVDSCEPDMRKGVRFERGVQVAAPKLGLVGQLDLVEKELTSGLLFPVEYKRGKPKPTDWDKIQLCAQALCLEEMTGNQVSEGALWYHQTRHRLLVNFDQEIRRRTLAIVEQVRALLHSGHTPTPQYSNQCDSCSLYELCLPKCLQKDQSKQYIKRLFSTDNADEETSK